MDWAIAGILLVVSFSGSLLSGILGGCYGLTVVPALLILGFSHLQVVPAILISHMSAFSVVSALSAVPVAALTVKKINAENLKSYIGFLALALGFLTLASALMLGA